MSSNPFNNSDFEKYLTDTLFPNNSNLHEFNDFISHFQELSNEDIYDKFNCIQYKYDLAVAYATYNELYKKIQDMDLYSRYEILLNQKNKLDEIITKYFEQ